jgi:hypothetical protein
MRVFDRRQEGAGEVVLPPSFHLLEVAMGILNLLITSNPEMKARMCPRRASCGDTQL